MSGRILQLAWRNLWRNPGRTLISTAAIALGFTLLLTFSCLLEGWRQQLIENGTRLSLSHAQVHAPGYFADRSVYKTLGGQDGTDVEKLLTTLTTDAQVQAVAPRVYAFGLVSVGQQSIGTALVGIVAELEQHITRLHTSLVQGHYLNPQLPKGVVVGEKLAKSLGAGIGSELVVLTQAADGSTGNDLYTIVGIFRTGMETLDRGTAIMAQSSLQELLSLAPNRVHEVGIRFANPALATRAAARLQRPVAALLPARIRAWPALIPELDDYARLNRGATSVIFIFVFCMGMLSVMNTMLMAVFERTRELGVLMSLGMRPVQVTSLILIEAGSLTGVSLMLGGGISLPILSYLQTYGLDLRPFVGAVSLGGVNVQPFWYGRHDFFGYGLAALGLALVTLVSALYPALRAARLQPIEAVRNRNG